MDGDTEDKPCKRPRVTRDEECVEESQETAPCLMLLQGLPDLVQTWSGDGQIGKECGSHLSDIDGLELPSVSADPGKFRVNEGNDCFDDETGEVLEPKDASDCSLCLKPCHGKGNINNSGRCNDSCSGVTFEAESAPGEIIHGKGNINNSGRCNDSCSGVTFEAESAPGEIIHHATRPATLMTFGFSQDSVMASDEDTDTTTKPGAECNAIAENSYIRSVEQLKFESNFATKLQNKSVRDTCQERPGLGLMTSASTDPAASPTEHDDEGVAQPPGPFSDTGFIDMFESETSSLTSSPCLTDTEIMADILNRRTRPDTSTKSTYTCNLASTSSTYPSNSEIQNHNFFLPCQKPKNQPFELDSEFLNTTRHENNVNSLPASVIVQIVSYLTPCTLLRCASCVCKYWYNLCRDSDLWRTINMRNQQKLTDTALDQLLNFSDRVLHVNLTDCRFVTDVGVRAVMSRCLHLQTLKLMRCFDLTDEAFVGLTQLRLCSQLQYLHLDGCYKITDRTILEVADACHQLKQLHLNQCTKVTDNAITTLARSCPRLTQLLLDHCDKVTDRSITELVRGCPDLMYLNLMSCGVTDDGVTQLAKLCKLKNVDLSNLPRISPRSVVEVSRCCRQLECVNISLNSVMDDHTVSQIARNGENLRRLYCVSCTISDLGLEDIARHRPQIEALDVGWCQDVTDDGIRMISRSCPNLGYLGLIRCDRVTISTVEDLVLQYPHINYSTFILESRRLIERARREGFQFGLSKKSAS